jgi:DNA-binding GntR family transcriptional regulator
MPTTSLNSQLVEQIIGHIRDGSLRPGERVTERGLAGRLRVSRSPVRRALAILRDRGVIEMDEDGAVIGTVLSLADARPSEPDGDEGIYFQIADDRLNGLLSDRVTENALLRRYALTRPRLTHILRRMSEEGWIERLPGHGWQFLPVLTSLDGYQDSYRFRLLIEPAAILEPGFVVDEPALGRVRQQQQQLVNGADYAA